MAVNLEKFPRHDYAYVNGSPINLTDPEGRFALNAASAAVGAAVGAGLGLGGYLGNQMATCQGISPGALIGAVVGGAIGGAVFGASFGAAGVLARIIHEAFRFQRNKLILLYFFVQVVESTVEPGSECKGLKLHGFGSNQAPLMNNPG